MGLMKDSPPDTAGWSSAGGQVLNFLGHTHEQKLTEIRLSPLM
jgi:hypothetical protein